MKTDPPSQKVNIVALFTDLRDFSHWSLEASSDQVADVVKMTYERLLKLKQAYFIDFYKPLGDGFLAVWEPERHGGIANSLKAALVTAFNLHKEYYYFRKTVEYRTPYGFGAGIACGEVTKVRPELPGETLQVDYVGYPMNCAARLQGLAGPYGVALDIAGVHIARTHPHMVLDDSDASREFKLLDPDKDDMIYARRHLKGILEEDIEGFQYVVWPEMQQRLWQTEGRIAAPPSLLTRRASDRQAY